MIQKLHFTPYFIKKITYKWCIFPFVNNCYISLYLSWNLNYLFTGQITLVIFCSSKKWFFSLRSLVTLTTWIFFARYSRKRLSWRVQSCRSFSAVNYVIRHTVNAVIKQRGRKARILWVFHFWGIHTDTEFYKVATLDVHILIWNFTVLPLSRYTYRYGILRDCRLEG